MPHGNDPVCRDEKTELRSAVIGRADCQRDAVCFSQTARNRKAEPQTNLQIFLQILMFRFEQRDELLLFYARSISMDDDFKTA